MTLVVGLVGGPGTGKSTTAAGVFHDLKIAGVNAELVTEYAKDLVWAGHEATLGNQIYVFGKQQLRLWRLLGKVDVIVTDSPLLLSLYYGEDQSASFRDLVLETWEAMDNFTVFLERQKGYSPKGRMQTELEATQIDRALRDLLFDHSIEHSVVVADALAGSNIANHVLKMLKAADE